MLSASRRRGVCGVVWRTWAIRGGGDGTDERSPGNASGPEHSDGIAAYIVAVSWCKVPTWHLPYAMSTGPQTRMDCNKAPPPSSLPPSPFRLRR